MFMNHNKYVFPFVKNLQCSTWSKTDLEAKCGTMTIDLTSAEKGEITFFDEELCSEKWTYL